MRGRTPTVLVLRALGLGDLLAAVPALRALARAYPAHRRLLAAPAWLRPVADWTGAVDEVVAAAPLEPLPNDVSHPTLAVNLHGAGPQSHRILAALRPHRLLAFRCDEAHVDHDGPAWHADEHERRRWCRLLHADGVEADADDLRLVPPDVELPGDAAGATLVHPGAARAAVRWPATAFAAVARAEMRSGRRVFVTGSAQERALALEVADRAGLGPDAVLAGRTDLPQLAALVAGAGRLVSSDTGAAHLAFAFATPSVTVYGPVSPSRWGPTDDGPHRVVWSGHVGDPHGPGVDPHLAQLPVRRVLDALASLDDTAATTTTGEGSRH